MSAPKISRIWRDLERFHDAVDEQGFGYACGWLDSGDYRVQIRRGRILMFSTTDKSPDWCIDQAYGYLARVRQLSQSSGGTT